MSSSPEERIPEDDDNAEAPLTMAASVVLTHLPKDASKALEMAGVLGVEKGTRVARARAGLHASLSPHPLAIIPLLSNIKKNNYKQF